MHTNHLLLTALALVGGIDAYAWMRKLEQHETTQSSEPLEKRVATCPVHATPQGAASYSSYYPSKYTGAKNGLPGTGKGGVLVPAKGDTAHAYKAPSASDIRGPCPALNMAANHNFISHDGLTNFNEMVDMAQNVFNWGWDLAVFVATFGIVMDGDPLTSQLSIGCTGGQPVPNTGLNTHNKFETDGSIARNDYYLSPTGDAYNVNATLFEYMTKFCDGVYDLDCMGPYMGSRYNQSKAENGNFFYSPLGLFAFGTATLPQESFASLGNQGTPDVATIAPFWAVTPDDSSSTTFTAHPGTERIPENWYNRPTTLSFLEIFEETASLYAAGGFPAFGGNTGKPNSFVGLTWDLGGIENGVLQDPSANGIACLFAQIVTDAVPLSLQDVLTLPTASTAWAKGKVAGLFEQFGCPAL